MGQGRKDEEWEREEESEGRKESRYMGKRKEL